MDRNIVAMDDFDLDESLYDFAAAEAAVPDVPENQSTAPDGEGDVSDDESGEADAVTYVKRTFPDNPSAPDQNIPAVINSLLATQNPTRDLEQLHRLCFALHVLAAATLVATGD